MSALERWLAEHTEGAPPALRRRVERWVVEAPAEGSPVERLATAAQRALAHAVAGPTDRSAAVDVLAADALVTLALLAQAEREPGALAEFAAELRRSATQGA